MNNIHRVDRQLLLLILPYPVAAPVLRRLGAAAQAPHQAGQQPAAPLRGGQPAAGAAPAGARAAERGGGGREQG